MKHLLICCVDLQSANTNLAKLRFSIATFESKTEIYNIIAWFYDCITFFYYNIYIYKNDSYRFHIQIYKKCTTFLECEILEIKLKVRFIYVTYQRYILTVSRSSKLNLVGSTMLHRYRSDRLTINSSRECNGWLLIKFSFYRQSTF